ncbi:hypothetical protein SAMD00019534_022330, partial [Acytostelium subglobosum LB1]|uniref:hypothetical protein n=1 Tax=Acytostelium subglobosum LB1 TaxID=1410327 RepID=UPI000645157B
MMEDIGNQDIWSNMLSNSQSMLSTSITAADLFAGFDCNAVTSSGNNINLNTKMTESTLFINNNDVQLQQQQHNIQHNIQQQDCSTEHLSSSATSTSNSSDLYNMQELPTISTIPEMPQFTDDSMLSSPAGSYSSSSSLSSPAQDYQHQYANQLTPSGGAYAQTSSPSQPDAGQQLNNPFSSTSMDTLESEYNDMMNTPFTKESFFSKLKMILPTFTPRFEESQENDDNATSTSSSHKSEKEGKKRGRDAEAEAAAANITVLSKEEVLKLSSKEIEEYSAKLKQAKLISSSEEKELKKQRRLIKNREYASQSRSRKKVYVDTIESKLDKVNQENDNMRDQLDNFKNENRELKKQLFSLTSTLRANPALAEAFGKIFSLGTAAPNKTAANVTLFVFFVLFTFSFLLPMQQSTFIFTQSGNEFVQRHLLNGDSFGFSKYSFFDKTNNITNQILEETRGFLSNLFGPLANKRPVDSSLYDELTNSSSSLKSPSSTSSSLSSSRKSPYSKVNANVVGKSHQKESRKIANKRQQKKAAEALRESMSSACDESDCGSSSPLTCSSPYPHHQTLSDHAINH